MQYGIDGRRTSDLVPLRIKRMLGRVLGWIDVPGRRQLAREARRKEDLRAQLAELSARQPTVHDPAAVAMLQDLLQQLGLWQEVLRYAADAHAVLPAPAGGHIEAKASPHETMVLALPLGMLSTETRQGFERTIVGLARVVRDILGINTLPSTSAKPSGSPHPHQALRIVRP